MTAHGVLGPSAFGRPRLTPWEGIDVLVVDETLDTARGTHLRVSGLPKTISIDPRFWDAKVGDPVAVARRMMQAGGRPVRHVDTSSQQTP